MESNQEKLTVEDCMQMAREIQARKGCSWREATLAVKRQHPQARAAFVEHGRKHPVPL